MFPVGRSDQKGCLASLTHWKSSPMQKYCRNLWMLGLLLLPVSPVVTRADFAFRPGDTVVFLGDSITAARGYGKIIENYTLLRFPDRQVRFINSGRGGDTAAGGFQRLERDVFAHKASVLVVAYGINDIGWGTKADDEHRQQYLDSIRKIVAACKQRGVRVFICSAAITAEDPDKATGGYLETMCDDGMTLAKDQGESAIDLQRYMRAVQRRVIEANALTPNQKDHASLHAEDGIHLNDLGQLAMAVGILKGLGAPAEVSSVTVQTGPGNQTPALIQAAACKVLNLERSGNQVTFDRLDNGLPLNLGLFVALQYRFVHVPDEINRYMLIVQGLPPGTRHEVLVDGRSLGTHSAEQLQEGLNISSATGNGWQPGGPWDAQAWALVKLTDARNELAKGLAETHELQPDHPGMADLQSQAAETNAQLERLQRTLVRPRPFHFVIQPAPTETAK